MKIRRTVITVVLIAAVLCIGIGYAAINDSLTVGGNVSVGVTGIPEVRFMDDGITVDYDHTRGAKTGVTYEIVDESAADEDESDKFVITVPSGVLLTKDDKITVKVPVVNVSESYDAEVTLDSIASQADGLYSVTCSWEGGSESPVTIGKNNDREDVLIEIKLLKNPTEAVSNNKFTITYTAEAVS